MYDSFCSGRRSGRRLSDRKNDFWKCKQKKKHRKQSLCNHDVSESMDGSKAGGGSIERYLCEKDYHKIMIYGAGYIGERLIDELEDSQVEIVAAMDRAVVFADVPVISVNDEIPDVDCIVVTPVFYFEDIYKMLSEKTNIPILSISEIVENL